MTKKNITADPVALYEKIKNKLSPTENELKLLDKAYGIAEQFSKERAFYGKYTHLIHTMEVSAIVLDEMILGFTSTIAVLLHEPVLYNMISLDNVRKEFSAKSADIIKSLCKINEIKEKGKSKQTENFRKFILNLANDMRVILIKLADVLNFMRIGKELPENERIKIASDAYYLYAPLAHRLGLYKIKLEMEDLAMKYTDYETYISIAKRLKETAKTRNKFIKDFITPIDKKLKDNGLSFEIKGRPKTIHSIWNKMQTKHVSFDDIYDKFAIRIILNSKPENEKSDCWKVYSLITETYQPNPKRLRDWISVPKSNGYESLHTTVVVPGGQWVEVQIRTQRMDDIAERGFAAHWKYKEGKKEGSGIDQWLSNIRELIESPEQESEEIIDDFKLSLYSKEIFIFTPKGDLKNLPSGSTVLDFAYGIHTALGDTCVGAKVNGKNVPIRYQLQNGDKIEIIASKNQKPKQDWLNFVVTSRAKSKIKFALNEEKLKEAENGKEIVKRRLKNWKIEYNDSNILKLLKHFKLKLAIDLYYLIATEKIDILSCKEILTANEETHHKPEETEKENRTVKTHTGEDYLVIDQKVDKVEYKLAKCCNPIFGDDVFGFVTINEGIKIHRKNCPNARDMISKFGYRVVPAQWTEKGESTSYTASLRVTAIDEVGMLSNISDVITNEFGTNLRSINLETNDSLLEGQLKVLVFDKKHLEGLIKKLKLLKGVISVTRLG